MLKLTVKIGELATAECEGQSQQDIWQQAAFWHGLPTVCPVDGTPVKFGYKEAGDFKYFTLLSSGERVYEFPIGQGTGERGMFPGKVLKEGKDKVYVQRWVYYDHDAQREVVVWENGRLLIEAPSNTRPGFQAQPAVVVEHRSITAREDLDFALEEVARLDFDAIPGAVTDAQKIEALGLAYYRDKRTWETKVKGQASYCSKQRTTLLAELRPEEAAKLLQGLEAKVREEYDITASELFEAKIQQPDVDPDNLNGLALASAYTKLCKIAEGAKVAA